MHMTDGSFVRLYPKAWRQRYGDEMLALLEVAPMGWRDRLDLLRGAFDAWLHPAAHSRVPAAAALIGGGLWTVSAAAVAFQPTPPDWPGYLTEILVLALGGAGFLLVATLGCALRAGTGARHAMRLAVGFAIVGYLTWIVALTATLLGTADGTLLATGHTLAMVGTTLVGLALVRAGDARVGFLVMTGPIAMLIPWTVLWLAFGAAWTAVGIVLSMERALWPGERWRLS
jgi:hypothetical protein